MGFSNEVTALYSLVKANYKVQALFERHPYAMLLGAIKCSAMEVQLQKMFCAIISIRQRRKFHAVNEAFRAYVDTRLKDQSVTINLDLSSTPSSESMEMLKDAVDICNYVTHAERSIVRIQLPKIAARIQNKISKDRFYRTMRHPFSMSFKSRQSPTELHRIRRALWRLRLYFEAFYEPYLPPAINEQKQVDPSDCHLVEAQAKPAESSGVWGLSYEAKCDYIRSQGVFFLKMTVWELEEVECVWYHLRHQSSTLWCRPCPHCRQHCLPDDLIGHMRECRQHMDFGDRLPQYGCNFEKACSWFRRFLEDNIRGQSTANKMATWPDPLAREPSAGFKFIMDRYPGVYPDDQRPGLGLTRGPLIDFVEWGYCIWDRERLEGWRLVDSEDEKVSAVLEWWRSDRWRTRRRE